MSFLNSGYVRRNSIDQAACTFKSAPHAAPEPSPFDAGHFRHFPATEQAAPLVERSSVQVARETPELHRHFYGALEPQEVAEASQEPA
jgi:hypothetical protein